MTTPEKSRASLKGWLTRRRQNLDRFLGESHLENVRTEIILFRKSLDSLREAQSKIEAKIDDEQALIDEINKEGVFDDECQSTLTDAEAFLAKAAPPPTTTVAEEIATQKFLKPKLTIRKFKGELLEWLPFRQSFDNAIGKQKNLPSSIKLQLLIENLEEEALNTVKYFSIIDQNYEPAYAALVEKYGDHDRLIEAYIEQLLELKTVGSTLSLRSIHDQLLCSVRTLETLDVKCDQYAVILVPMLRTIFSRPIKLKWAKFERKVKIEHKALLRADPDTKPVNRLSLFLEFLKEEVEIQETADNANSHPAASVKKDDRPKPSHQGQGQNKFLQGQGQSKLPFPRLSTVMLNQNRSSGQGFGYQRRQLPPCPFCGNSGHHPASCQNASMYSAADVISLLSRDGRCHQCIGYHPNSSCRTQSFCSVCGAPHHVLTCPHRPTVNNSSQQFHSYMSHLIRTFSTCRHATRYLHRQRSPNWSHHHLHRWASIQQFHQWAPDRPDLHQPGPLRQTCTASTRRESARLTYNLQHVQLLRTW